MLKILRDKNLKTFEIRGILVLQYPEIINTEWSVWREWDTVWNYKVDLDFLCNSWHFCLMWHFKVDREREIMQQRSWTRFKPRMLWLYCVYLRPLHHSVGKISLQKQACRYQPKSLLHVKPKRELQTQWAAHTVRFNLRSFPLFSCVINLTVSPTYLYSFNMSCKHLIVFPGPKMVAVRNYHGTPAPVGKTPLCFQTGDFIELLKGDPDTTWWEVQPINHYLTTPKVWILRQLALYSSTLRTCGCEMNP